MLASSLTAQERPRAFYADLEALRKADGLRDILLLVDKKYSLPKGYVPDSLVSLRDTGSYAVSRAGLQLRAPAAEALRRLGAAAKKDGVTLLVSSAYRSYEYQMTVYAGHVKNLGKAEADRVSAMPGMSQHQLGTVVDFGPISEDFASAAAGKWMAAHGEEYGWSLSFPRGYEEDTGYAWEPWHWRYIGVEACRFQKNWFGDVQQFMLEFLKENF